MPRSTASPAAPAMLEWLFRERVSAVSFFNWALVTQKTLIDGGCATSSWRPPCPGCASFVLRLQVFARSHLDLQIAAVAGAALDSSSGDTIFPPGDAATEKKTPREPWEDARGVEKDWFSRTKPGASAPACSQRVASVRSELASPHRAGSDRASTELVSRGIRATEKKTPRESLGDARGV